VDMEMHFTCNALHGAIWVCCTMVEQLCDGLGGGFSSVGFCAAAIVPSTTSLVDLMVQPQWRRLPTISCRGRVFSCGSTGLLGSVFRLCTLDFGAAGGCCPRTWRVLGTVGWRMAEFGEHFLDATWHGEVDCLCAF